MKPRVPSSSVWGPPRLGLGRVSLCHRARRQTPCWSRTSRLSDVGNQLASCARTKCYAMTSILTALSVLAALVFGAMLVALLAEALDAYGRRR
jgi:hypothetical protein